MEVFLTYLKVFAVGGALCALGQLLINKTKMSSARILVTFMLLGLVLEIAGAFSYMKNLRPRVLPSRLRDSAAALRKARWKARKRAACSVR